MSHVIGLFKDSDQAGEAVSKLKAEDLAEELSVVTSDYEEGDFNPDKKQIERSAKDGAAAGAVGGGLIGLLAGLAAIPLPGTELLAIGGIGTTLASTGAGVVSGGVVGALVDYGMDQTKAEEYKKYVNEGQVLVAVEADSEEDATRVSRIMEDHQVNEMTITTNS
jgi:uncharacterized membrane protein